MPERKCGQGSDEDPITRGGECADLNRIRPVNVRESPRYVHTGTAGSATDSVPSGPNGPSNDKLAGVMRYGCTNGSRQYISRGRD